MQCCAKIIQLEANVCDGRFSVQLKSASEGARGLNGMGAARTVTCVRKEMVSMRDGTVLGDNRSGFLTMNQIFYIAIRVELDELIG